jgi:hypothetical protein
MEELVFRETKVIRSSFVTNVKPPDGLAYQAYAGITSNVARQLCLKELFRFGSCPGEAMGGFIHGDFRLSTRLKTSRAHNQVGPDRQNYNCW